MPAIHTERVPLSPAEKKGRERRCARALLQGVTLKDLASRGFTSGEVERALAMVEEKKKK